MIAYVNTTAGILVLAVAGTAVAILGMTLRRRPPGAAPSIQLALAGAALGAGALLVQNDVGRAAWILTPPVLAFLTVVHVRSLFAGSGPLRT